MRNVKRLAVLLFFASTAFAHDMWLEPARFSGRAGEPVELRLFVGEHFQVEEERPLGLDRAYRFQLFDQSKAANLGGEIRFPPGTGVVVMERIPAYIEFEAAKFNQYAAEEGHSERASAGTVVRERYTRHLKTILSGSAARDQDFRRPVGALLELIPLTDPRVSKRGDRFELLVLFEGKPLVHAPVSVYRKGTPDQLLRTDARGRARFVVEQPGVALVRATKLRPCRCDDADYESFWAALTFEVK